MADYGGAYVWNEHGARDYLANHFEDRAEYEQLVDLEDEMLK